MCEKSEFLWRERPVLYHVMPFRSSNYTNFSNYIWYGISKKRHAYLLKLPTIESVNKKNLNIRRIVQNFLIIFWISYGWMYTWTTIICLMNQSYFILHSISFFLQSSQALLFNNVHQIFFVIDSTKYILIYYLLIRLHPAVEYMCT